MTRSTTTASRLRGLGLLLALALGCVALTSGLFYLHGIFVEEREEALAEVAGRRRALEQFAHQELAQRFGALLASTRPTLDAAATDPLLPASELWLVDRGEQLLPRRSHPRASGPAEAGLLLDRLGRSPEGLLANTEALDPDGPWAERLRLLVALRGALDEGDRNAVEVAVRTILAHRASWVLATEREIPYTLAVLDLLDRRASPSPTLVGGLLRDGLSGKRSRVNGLQRQLLEHAERFVESDFAQLAAAIVRLCEKHQVLYADFARRVEEARARVRAEELPLPVPERLDGPTLIGTWYVEPAREGRSVGVVVQVGSVLDEIAASMRERSLIDRGDELVLASPAGALAIDALALSVESPRWAEAEASARSRYRLKAWLEGLIAALVFGVMGLGVVIYRRRHRFLELKSDFVSAVSHELRTPLASIRLMAETLERRTKDLPKARDYPSRIIRDVDALSFLVENILSFNRLARGRWVAKPERVALGDVVRKLELERDQWAKRPAELRWNDEVDACTLWVDPDLLQLLLTNLARNACTYNDREPAEISVEAAREERALVLSVRDNGRGIPEAERDRIFDDFYRAASAKTERGSGLGLSIARKIMEAHGGTIAIAATGPEGTTFELRFPVDAEVR